GCGEVSLRRLFWLGAAILFSIAALVAIAAVAVGHFGETEARILGTCGLAFICGSVALAGVACLDREIVRPAAWAAIVFGIAAFAIGTAGVWGALHGEAWGKTAGVVGVGLLVALM